MNNIKTQISYFIILIMAVFISSSCEHKAAQPAPAPKHIIQDTFFGLTLGKSNINDAIRILNQNGFRGNTEQDEDGDYFMIVKTPVLFGGVTWDSTIFRFTSKGTFICVLFNIDKNSQNYSQDDKDVIFSDLYNELTKKYYLENQEDGGITTYVGRDNYNEVNLSNDDGIYLGYGVKDEGAIDKNTNDL